MTEQPEWASKERQIELLTEAVAYFPNPTSLDADVPLPGMVRRPYAQRLYDKGVRIHPQLATVETTVVGDPRLGAYAQAKTTPVTRDDARMMDLLRQRDPQLADRVAAAATDEEKAALLAELEPAAMRGMRAVAATVNGAGR